MGTSYVDENIPLTFTEVTGENALDDNIRSAIVWASLDRFVAGTDSYQYVDQTLFTELQRQLAKAIVFHGPYEDLELLTKEAKRRVAIIVTPLEKWAKGKRICWLACLSS